MNFFRIVTITHNTIRRKSALLNGESTAINNDGAKHIGSYIPTVNADPSKLSERLHLIKKELKIDELHYIATCNRLTFLMVCKEPIDSYFIWQLFKMLHGGMSKEKLMKILDVVQIYDGLDAVQHIFEVASSLDSMVVGEREILGQLRTAYDYCNSQGLTGDSIRLLMKIAVPVAKEVYTKTKIGENSVSVVSLAIKQLLLQKPCKNSRILIIGAGQTNNLVAKFLLKHQFSNFTVFNRTLTNAEILAEKLGGDAYELSELSNYTKGFDIIITCTAASMPIIDVPIYEKLVNGEKDEKLIIDLAVPPDVDEALFNKDGLNYIGIGHLRELADQNMELRRKEIARASLIIEDWVKEFEVILVRRRIELGMSEIPTKVKEITNKAVTNIFQKEIAGLDEQSQAILSKVVSYIEKKYIGIPMSVARTVLEKELELRA